MGGVGVAQRLGGSGPKRLRHRSVRCPAKTRSVQCPAMTSEHEIPSCAVQSSDFRNRPGEGAIFVVAGVSHIDERKWFRLRSGKCDSSFCLLNRQVIFWKDASSG